MKVAAAPAPAPAPAASMLSPYFDVVVGPDGQPRMEVAVDGIALLRLVLINKGTAFTREERLALGLEGLLAAADQRPRHPSRPGVPRLPRRADRAGALPVLARAAGAAGDPVLRAARAAPRGDAAGGLHADRRGVRLPDISL